MIVILQADAIPNFRCVFEKSAVELTLELFAVVSIQTVDVGKGLVEATLVENVSLDGFALGLVVVKLDTVVKSVDLKHHFEAFVVE